MASTKPTLSTPMQIGSMKLSHRIVMAPMTRLRSTNEQVPLEIVKTYYEQRASIPGTLLITEATFISEGSRGRDANAPGVFNPEQISRWRAIVDAVHKRGSFIVCQLWHVGRAARAHELERLGLECLSSSAIRMPTTDAVPNAQGQVDGYVTPHPMSEEEIRKVLNDFVQAARNAVYAAGFDGVEIHAANGYLVDQFTQSTCNQRDDHWGGSVENRSLFCLEITRGICNAIGSKKTGIRLSPFSSFQGMGMDDPVPQFYYLIEQLRGLDLAYLHLIEPRVNGNVDREAQRNESLEFAFRAWNKAGPIILAGGYKPDSARKGIEEVHKDNDVAIAFGRHFISNPDLPYRVLNSIQLNAYDRDTFYKVQSPEGYIDYSFAHA